MTQEYRKEIGVTLSGIFSFNIYTINMDRHGEICFRNIQQRRVRVKQMKTEMFLKY